MHRTRIVVLASLLAASCGDDPRAAEEEVDDDAGLPDSGLPIASDAAAPSDASVPCAGPDPIAQILCQLLGGGAAQPAAGQPDLTELLGILTQLGGQLGGQLGAPRPDAGSMSAFGRARDASQPAPPSERDCANPRDRMTELLCRMTRDASVRERPGADGGRDAGADGSVAPRADASAPADAAPADAAPADAADAEASDATTSDAAANDL